MADISKIKLPNDNTTYNVKDSAAVTTIQIDGTAQTKTNGVVNLPAYPNVDSEAFGRGTEIPANADIHTYKTPGVYYSPSSSRSATLSNAPTTGSGFRLVVTEETTTDGTRIRHDAYTIGSSTSLFYSENLGASSTAYPDGWRPWRLFGPVNSVLSSAGTNYEAPTVKAVYDDQVRQDAAITKCVDEEPKNLCKITALTQTIKTVKFTIDANSGTIIANGTASGNGSLVISDTITTTEEMFLTGTPSGASGYDVRFGSGSTYRDTGSGVLIPSGVSQPVQLTFNSGTVFSNVTIKPMLCTKADWDVSNKFVPYALSNKGLYDNKEDIKPISIPSGADLDDYTESGSFRSASSTITDSLYHCPTSGIGFTMDVRKFSDNGSRQVIYNSGTTVARIYIRTKKSTGWMDWFVFESTTVAPSQRLPDAQNSVSPSLMQSNFETLDTSELMESNPFDFVDEIQNDEPNDEER